MPQLDQISAAIGELQADVRSVKDGIKEVKETIGEMVGQIDTMHDEIEPRLRSLEDHRMARRGALVVLGGIGGAVSGSAVTLFGKWLAAKVGL